MLISLQRDNFVRHTRGTFHRRSRPARVEIPLQLWISYLPRPSDSTVQSGPSPKPTGRPTSDTPSSASDGSDTPARHRLAHKRASAAKASSCSQSLHLVPPSALLHIILLITLTKCPSLRGRDVIQSLRPSPHEAYYPSLLSPDSSTTQFVPARPNIAIR